MGLFDITDSVLERALAGSAMRQTALANNLANANTPGFKRSDLDFQSALAGALDTSPDLAQATVDALELAPQTDTSATMRVDGNSVDVDTEMAKLSENSVGYQALVSVEHARMSMLQSVIGGR